MKLRTKILSLLLASTMVVGAAACASESGTIVGGIQDQLNGEQTQDNSNISALQEQIAQLQQSLQSKFDELNGETDALKEQIAQLESQVEALKGGNSIAYDSYEKVKYIDANLSDRDCYNGENFNEAKQWITDLSLASGYNKDEVTTQDVTISAYAKKTDNLDEKYSAAKSHETDGKFYTRSGRNYVEDENGDYVKVSVVTENIIVSKEGKSDKQIIVGAHYDGTGTGDNGSGVALALTMAEKLAKVETPYTIQFVFFTAEEYGCYGSTAYANAMSDGEVANTLYMINLDSLVCGDYCYIYGGVQNNEEKTVTQTEAYDNAMKIANSLGLDFHSNPWTWDNPEPTSKTGVPDYASPSTGDWSDHKGFKNRGIKYLYMEATNWEIPDYSGYGETVLVGMLMNTENDYLEYIEHYFPGRIQQHLTQFSTLLYALLVQPDVNF